MSTETENTGSSYTLAGPIEAAELDLVTGEVVTAMIDFCPGDKLSIEHQSTNDDDSVRTVFSAMRLPCGLRGTGPNGEDEWLGPFRYETGNLPMLTPESDA